jgi:hypothetical protein
MCAAHFGYVGAGHVSDFYWRGQQSGAIDRGRAWYRSGKKSRGERFAPRAALPWVPKRGQGGGVLRPRFAPASVARVPHCPSRSGCAMSGRSAARICAGNAPRGAQFPPRSMRGRGRNYSARTGL